MKHNSRIFVQGKEIMLGNAFISRRVSGKPSRAIIQFPYQSILAGRGSKVDIFIRGAMAFSGKVYAISLDTKFIRIAANGI